MLVLLVIILTCSYRVYSKSKFREILNGNWSKYMYNTCLKINREWWIKGTSAQDRKKGYRPLGRANRHMSKLTYLAYFSSTFAYSVELCYSWLPFCSENRHWTLSHFFANFHLRVSLRWLTPPSWYCHHLPGLQDAYQSQRSHDWYHQRCLASETLHCFSRHVFCLKERRKLRSSILIKLHMKLTTQKSANGITFAGSVVAPSIKRLEWNDTYCLFWHALVLCYQIVTVSSNQRPSINF